MVYGLGFTTLPHGDGSRPIITIFGGINIHEIPGTSYSRMPRVSWFWPKKHVSNQPISPPCGRPLNLSKMLQFSLHLSLGKRRYGHFHTDNDDHIKSIQIIHDHPLEIERCSFSPKIFRQPRIWESDSGCLKIYTFREGTHRLPIACQSPCRIVQSLSTYQRYMTFLTFCLDLILPYSTHLS